MAAEAQTAILEGNPTFNANVEALTVRQPDLAQRLRRAEPPTSARIVTGRDGHLVVQLAADETTIHWLGGSSMPSVSAPALLASFADRGANVALPSIGTGYELQLLLRCLPAHCAVFVCEPDTMLIALALAVVDLSSAIDRGRVVFADGDVEESLVDFLAGHPGFLLPTQLYSLPGSGDAELSARTAAIERASRRANTALNKRSAELAGQVKGLTFSSPGERPRVLVLSLDAVGGGVQFAEPVGAALAAMDWPAALCVPNAADRCHDVTRLAAIRDHRPELILFVNCTPGPLLSALPSAMPYACWFLESATLPAVALEGLAECRHLLAASQEVRAQLLARGAQAESVTVLETGVDDTLLQPGPAAMAENAAPGDVAIFCDGQDISPKASNIGLESHARVWRRTIELLTRAVEQGRHIDVENLFREAQQRTATHLKDDESRNQFSTLLAGRLVKTVVARTTLEMLLSAAPEMTVALWGTGWQSHPSVRSAHRGPIPPPADRNKIYQTAKVVVLPFADAAAMHYAAESLAAGCCPLLRRAEPSLVKIYPQTSDILNAVPSFTRAAELADDARRLVGEVEQREALVARLRARLLAEHTVRHRLLAIRDMLTSARA